MVAQHLFLKAKFAAANTNKNVSPGVLKASYFTCVGLFDLILCDKCFLLKDHNVVTPVRLEPAAPRSRIKYSTTEPLH